MIDDASSHDAPPPSRLAFIDGLRGVTALYIVMYHCYFIEVTSLLAHKSFSAWTWLGVHWMGFGEEAMPVFMVLTGFVLMRSALQPDGATRFRLNAFAARRARRILPGYFAALVASLALFAVLPSVMSGMNAALFKSEQSAPFERKTLAAHLVLAEHAKYTWKFAIDPPIWGAAAVWWNDMLLALVLLPLWRKMGAAVTVTIVFAVSLLPHFLLNAGDASSPWFAGIVTLGMMAAAQTNAPSPRTRMVWLCAAALAFCCCQYIGFLRDDWMWKHIYTMDILTGIATACFIVYCVRLTKAAGSPRPMLLGLLESKPLVELGAVSYSLCLTHFPILWLLHVYLTQNLHGGPLTKMVALMALGIPATLVAAKCFALAFDRPARR